ncbi:hypothetical protein [Massilia putida]|uniref:hypothetical protein n=1 Tax=Massilia putida TaxID=1141883 RepID=UPI0012ECA81F|nr:hypothetical protein [Massilia putida]
MMRIVNDGGVGKPAHDPVRTILYLSFRLPSKVHAPSDKNDDTVGVGLLTDAFDLKKDDDHAANFT